MVRPLLTRDASIYLQERSECLFYVYTLSGSMDSWTRVIYYQGGMLAATCQCYTLSMNVIVSVKCGYASL